MKYHKLKCFKKNRIMGKRDKGSINIIYVNDYFVFKNIIDKKLIDDYLEKGMAIIPLTKKFYKLENELIDLGFTIKPCVYKLKHNIKDYYRSIVYQVLRPNELDIKLFLSKIKKIAIANNIRSFMFANKEITLHISTLKRNVRVIKTKKNYFYNNYVGKMLPISFRIYHYRNNHFSIENGEFLKGFKKRFKNLN